jgi:DNA-binding protein H-NS
MGRRINTRLEMATINYDKMSAKELVDHIARAQKALNAAKDRERSELKHKISSLAENAGFSVNELFGARGKGKAVAVKYMNPDNRSETWTGRGRKPNWLVAKLSKGAKMTDFAV